MRRLSVLFILLLAGCTGPVKGADLDLSGHEQVDSLEFGLADFTGQTLLIEVVLERDGVLRIDADPRLGFGEGLGTASQQRTDRQDVCMRMQIGASSRDGIAFGMGGALDVRTQGEDVTAAWQTDENEFDAAMTHSAHVQAMTPTLVLVALRDAPEFLAAGDTLHVRIDAGQPMHVRHLPEPGFHCIVRPGDMEGGSYVDIGLVRRAEGLHATWEIKDQAYGLVWSSAARGEYDVTLSREGSVIAHHETDGFGGFAGAMKAFVGDPGEYRLDVERLSGTTAPGWLTFAVAVFADLPATTTTS